MKTKLFQIPGFRFCGIAAGIKGTKKNDLALIVSDRPAKAVATFTTNRLKAAPVLQGQAVLKKNSLCGVVVNSGNANAATGKRGLQDSLKTASEAERFLKLPKGSVLVSSTGKIGIPLPVQKIVKALPLAASQLSAQGLSQAAHAIMTTDAFPKMHSVQGKIGGKTFHLAGFAKGAGMIEPHMATMLAYVMTDLDMDLALMRKTFRKAVDESFNSITVDGDTSTNDTALLMANGASGIKIRSGDAAATRAFTKALEEVCRTLAWMMVKDGEGATTIVEVFIRGAKSAASAKKIAYSIARSQLVKTSFFGRDPNWGRVFAAVGYSGETFDPSSVDIYYGPVQLVRRGQPLGGSTERKAHSVMKGPGFRVLVDLHQGKGEAKIWTSDLSYDYVRINAEYRT